MTILWIIPLVICWCNIVPGTLDPMLDGQNTIADFKHRYNTTKEVDLVFVLDRSGSVPRPGWISMINFVKDLLEYFTVDKDNTRVAIISFSTNATLDINDLEPGPYSDLENKCTLNWRIQYYIERKIPYGYTSTYAALEKAYNVLLNSRPNSKKAVLILTDGRSNIGQPPVKMAFEILSLKWNHMWNESTLGPQVEIYGFGIENASMPELVSIASSLPNHTFLIPSFDKFEHFARRLHGDKQEERWVVTRGGKCSSCGTKHAHCMCGAKVGQYVCACDPGYEREMSICVACRRGYYKDRLSPEPCKKCPQFTTTASFGSKDVNECELLPGYRKCPPLPSIENGYLFYVTGTGVNEVADTGRPCENVTDGNSCHYRCTEGYRLSGSPVMICQRNGQWNGHIPNCTVVDCGRIEDTSSPVDFPVSKVILNYVNDTTTFGSTIQASCPQGSVDIGRNTWSCDKNGRWTRPKNFACADVYCRVLLLPADASAQPDECGRSKLPLGSVCSFKCRAGYMLTGMSKVECSFDRQTGTFWGPRNDTHCLDTENPTITCPEDIEVDVPHMSLNGTVVHYNKVAPRLSDNSGVIPKYRVIGAPSNNFFMVGITPLKYEASDSAGNTNECIQSIHVKAKTAEVLFCPMDISIDAVGLLTVVTWVEPVFVDSENNLLEVECQLKRGSEFPVGVKENVCYPKDHNFHGVSCEFQVSVIGPACDIPRLDRLPANGALVCGEAHKYPRSCRIHCNSGYTVRSLHPARHSYSCDWDGIWKPPVDDKWPDCKKTYWEKELTIVNNVTIEFTGSCEESKEEIKKSFIATILKILEREHGPCPQSTGSTCNVTRADVFCRPETGRHKRNVEDSPGNKTSAFIKLGIRVKTNLTDENLEELYDQKNSHPLITFLDDFYAKMNHIHSAGLSFEADNFTVDITLLKHKQADFGKCKDGQIEDPDTYFPRCYACSIGTFKNKDSCEPCPRDFYQEQDGQTQCVACPNNTYTTSVGARNLTECRANCAENEFGENGLEPCSPCPPRYYQPNTSQDHCVPCPGTNASLYCNETVTLTTIPASASLPESYNCSALCQNGTCNISDGVESCRCLPGFAGLYCDEDIDDCAGVDCKNNGSCIDDVYGFICSCTAGFEGTFCERETDECESSPCLNNSICMDLIDDYTCYCDDGFEGKRCEIDTDDCRSSPCLYGECLDYIGGYVCDCDDGYTGDNCEMTIDQCADIYCENGGTCTRTLNGSQCICPDGFSGQLCSRIVNKCDNITCENGGTCLALNFIGCKCRLGFTGKFCQNVASTDFDLVFAEASTSRYVLMRLHENLRDLTTCAWIRTGDNKNYGTIISYAADSNWLGSHSGNDFTVYDYGGLQIFVNGESVRTQVTISDGVWHHVCVTWSSGSGQWQLFIDGRKRAGDYGLAIGTYIQRDGYYILGQDQDYMGGGFNTRESFIGEISQFFMTSNVLEDEQFVELVRSCTSIEGDVFSWSDVLGGLTGPVIKRSPSRCLDKNECLQANICGGAEYCVDTLGSFHCKSCQHFKICENSIEYHNDSIDVDVICSSGGDCAYGYFDDVSQCLYPEDANIHEQNYENRLYCFLCPEQFQDALEEVDAESIEGPADAECQCSVYPCLNGGTCSFNGISEECICAEGFSGTYCGLISHGDQCDNDTCKHGGNCTQHEAGPVCACAEGWRGRHCQVEFSPSCDYSPCVNNGTCIPSNGSLSYQCLCEEHSGKRLGPNCEELSPCSSSPCVNNGACIHLSASNHVCQCRRGFEGARCELKYSPVTTAPGYTEELLSGIPIKTTLKPTETGEVAEKDYCRNADCLNGGSCKGNKDAGFECLCKMDFKGSYCEEKRGTAANKYRVQLTLLMKYSPTLAHNVTFKDHFKQQVHKTYLNDMKDSKLQINITSFSEGSVLVGFLMVHTTYLDSSALGPLAMEDVLAKALKRGKLGDLDASIENFQFNRVKEEQNGRTLLYAVIGVLVIVILIAFLVVVVVYTCKRRRKPSGVRYYNAPSKHILQNNISNPAFEADSEPTSPVCFKDDNIYAEPAEFLLPYSVTTFKEDPDSDLSQRYPSKRGRDINKDWDRTISRQSIPLPPKPYNVDPDYTPTDRGVPLPRYSQVAADLETIVAAYADRTLDLRCKGKTAPPFCEEKEERRLVRTGSGKSLGSSSGDNPGFVDSTYLEPRGTVAGESSAKPETKKVPPVAPLYLELRPDTPPLESDTLNNENKEDTAQSAASENNGQITRM